MLMMTDVITPPHSSSSLRPKNPALTPPLFPPSSAPLPPFLRPSSALPPPHKSGPPPPFLHPSSAPKIRVERPLYYYFYILSGFHVSLPSIELRDVYICSKRYFWQFSVKISRVSSEIAVFNVYKQIVKKP